MVSDEQVQRWVRIVVREEWEGRRMDEEGLAGLVPPTA